METTTKPTTAYDVVHEESNIYVRKTLLPDEAMAVCVQENEKHGGGFIVRPVPKGSPRHVE